MNFFHFINEIISCINLFMEKEIEIAFNELTRNFEYYKEQVVKLEFLIEEATALAETQKKTADSLKGLARKSLFYAAAGDVKSIKELYEGVNLYVK